MREKRNWVFSPWLSAAYPVVALLAVNLRMLQPIEAFRSWVILTLLNAYYLPGNGKDKLYPTISPVNSFRLVLDTYLGADLPLLPDKTYTYGGEPYEFTLTRGICPVEATP